jgi:hypothetical protein
LCEIGTGSVIDWHWSGECGLRPASSQPKHSSGSVEDGDVEAYCLFLGWCGRAAFSLRS